MSEWNEMDGELSGSLPCLFFGPSSLSLNSLQKKTPLNKSTSDRAVPTIEVKCK